MKKFKSILAASLFAAVASASFGCSTTLDDDALRSGAIQIPLETVINDELFPSAGDEIDWKMVFFPTPGDVEIHTFWDHYNEIFDVQIGLYDRFGIPIKTETRGTAGKSHTLKAFTPEAGLHFIKVSGASGRSIYSIDVRHISNYDGFEAPSTLATFDEYIDFDAEQQAKQDASAKKAAAAAAPAAPTAGAALPVAGAGGMALPTAAAGGIASPGAPASEGATIVRTPSPAATAPSEVKTLSNNAGATSSTDTIKPICPDIKGKSTSVTADILSVSSSSSGSKVKLNAGSKDGVKEGSVVDIYVNGKILDGGRCRVDTITASNCTCTTNAPSKIVKTASKFVIKVPN